VSFWAVSNDRMTPASSFISNARIGLPFKCGVLGFRRNASSCFLELR
jgi:hypothetical protein